MVGADIASSGYYNATPAGTDPVETERTIRNAVLAYESVHVKPSKIREMQTRLANKGELIFHYDKPHVQVYSLPQNIRNINQTFVIPASCRILYLAFFKSWQLFYTPAKKKRTSTHLFYPENLTKLSLDFAHNQDILIKDGLHDIGNIGHNNHPSQRLFYNYLREKNIFKYDFETLFPSGSERLSSCQAVAVDLGDKGGLGLGQRSPASRQHEKEQKKAQNHAGSEAHRQNTADFIERAAGLIHPGVERLLHGLHRRF